MSKVLRTLRRAVVVLLVATLAVATASAAFADDTAGDSGKSDEVHQTKENGTAQNDDKGNASSHQTTAQNGVSTEPQPISSADDNGTGANQTEGPYRSTRDGSPSGNGNGNGEATPASPAPQSVEVLGLHEERSSVAASSEVAAWTAQPQPAGQTLPLTGANILALLLIAASIVSAGTFVTKFAGRKSELI